MDVYKKIHGSHINTFRIKKLMTHSRLFPFFWGGKIPCIEKLLILEKYLDGKLV
jgi:hypothetical protein